MRRVYGDTLASVGGVLLVLLALVSFDDRVRGQVAALVDTGKPTVELASAGERTRELALVVIEAARDQSIDHAPLTIFAVAAVVLVVFMLRT